MFMLFFGVLLCIVTWFRPAVHGGEPLGGNCFTAINDCQAILFTFDGVYTLDLNMWVCSNLPIRS